MADAKRRPTQSKPLHHGTLFIGDDFDNHGVENDVMNSLPTHRIQYVLGQTLSFLGDSGLREGLTHEARPRGPGLERVQGSLINPDDPN